MHFTRIFPPTIRLTFAVRYSSLKKKEGINKFHGVKKKIFLTHWYKFSDKSGTDVGSTAQALRDIVERVVEEAKRLPGLGSCDGSGRIREERNGVENSYEEVLATTILNKVIEIYSFFGG